jgi:large subunit ribosomal protein L9
MAEKLAGLKVTITGKAGAGTRLYGSITSLEIAEALAKQHSVKVDKRLIHITGAIKNTGEYEVPIKLYQSVSAMIHVNVIGQPAE